MAKENVTLPLQKIRVKLPKALIEYLNEVVPAELQNRFIVEAIERGLDRLESERALAGTAGVQKEEDYPMATVAGR